MKILILSHTRNISNFKIGSHHYANGLSDEHNIEYLGFPYTIFHKLTGKDRSGIEQLNSKVSTFQAFFLFPITIGYNKLFIYINKKILSYFSRVHKKNFDCIICDTPYFSPYLELISYRKLIYRPTDIYEKMDGFKVEPYEKEIINLSNEIIATSDVVMNYLRKKYPNETRRKKISFIANGYDDSCFNKLNLPKVRTGAIYIGALDERFDFDALEHLSSSFPDEKFDIYGPISNDFKLRVKEIAERRNNVFFHNAVEYYKTPDLLKSHKIGLLLLKNSELNRGRSPMKLWEYISCGLSVLYSAVEIDKKYSRMEELVKYNNIDELVDKYLQIKKNNFSNFSQSLTEHSWKFKVAEIKNKLES